MEMQDADAKTLVTLLHLREIMRETGVRLNTTSEMLDDRNRKLAEVTQADDFIVSDNLISMMMAQVAETADLDEVFSSLFQADGAEFYLRPAEWYVPLETAVTFYDVVAGAANRDETAIGVRWADADGKASVVVNPAKAGPYTFRAGDKIVVLAED